MLGVKCINVLIAEILISLKGMQRKKAMLLFTRTISVMIITKGIHGYLIYPTKAGIPHSGFSNAQNAVPEIS